MNDTQKNEPKVEAEVKAELQSLERRVLMIAALLVFIVGGGIAGAAYVAVTGQTIYIEKSAIDAPEVDLAPSVPGVLQNIFVAEGQNIPPNTVVAQVGNELLKSTAGGLVISASHDIGKSVGAGVPVVKVIDPKELRVVGQLQEDKGLKDVKVGDRASFTVDAFGGKKYYGVVSEVSPTSENSSVVFSISDKRETKNFDIKVYFDESQYPELKNGMSARIWVYKQ